MVIIVPGQPGEVHKTPCEDGSIPTRKETQRFVQSFFTVHKARGLPTAVGCEVLGVGLRARQNTLRRSAQQLLEGGPPQRDSCDSNHGETIAGDETTVSAIRQLRVAHFELK